MTSTRCDSATDEGLAIGDPKQDLALATGVEVGLFGRSACTHARSCMESCLADSRGRSVEGACELVRALAEHSPPEGYDHPRLCDRGHMVLVMPGIGSTSWVLLVRPAPALTTGSRSAQYARQMKASGALWQHLERATQEGQGLAMELISSYEQLNVIFEITEHVGQVQDVHQIKLFLLRKLAETLTCDWACCVSGSHATHWWCDADSVDRGAIVRWVVDAHSDAVGEVTGQQRIVVRNLSGPPNGGEGFSLMVGPLGNEDGEANVVVLGRRWDRSEFQSGEMRILDSVLNHGRQVISNLRLAERVKTLSYEAVLALVSAIDKKDSYTCGHSERVGLLSRLIGEELDLSATELQDLEWAGILHDVGKIGIADGILSKPGGLTDVEFGLVKQHPRMSFEVIEPLQSFGAVRATVLHHHETPDGNGYPDGLQGDDIPLLARIVHTADSFDALTSDRSYRRGFAVEKALEIMRKEVGVKFDSDTMDAFERAFQRFRAQQPERYQELFAHFKELTA